MAQRPQGCKSLVMTADGTILATTILNKTVYGITIATNGAVAGELVVLRDSATGTIRWRGRIELATGTIHVDFGRYGINFPTGIYLQFTGGNKEITVIYD